MADDLIGLFPKEPEKDLGEPDPKYASIKAMSLPRTRDIGTAFFVAIGICFVPICIAVETLGSRPGGPAVVSAMAYTLIIPYIISNRFLRRMPWDLLRQHWKKFLSLHCAALIVVCAISSFAFAVKPQLPAWFTTGHKPPFFYCFGGILLVLAFWECSWMSKKSTKASDD